MFYLAAIYRFQTLDNVWRSLSTAHFIKMFGSLHNSMSKAAIVSLFTCLLLAVYVGAQVNSEPITANAFLRRGIDKINNQDFEGAIKDLSKAIDLNPEQGILYYNRGLAKCRKGTLDEGIADLSRAIELNPNLVPAYINRGQALTVKGDLQPALTDLSAALSLNFKTNGTNSQSAELYIRRACIRARLKDTDGALADLHNAAELRTDWAMIFRVYGDVFTLRGSFEDARTNYEKAVRLSTDEAAYAHFFIILINRRLNYPQSLPAFRETVLGWKKDWEKSVGLFLTDDIDEKAFLELAAKGDAKTINSHQCEAYYYIGMLRLLKSDSNAAETMFEKCLGTKACTLTEFLFAEAELTRLHDRK